MTYNAVTAWERLWLQVGAIESKDPLTGGVMFICDSLSLRGSGAFSYLKSFYGISLKRDQKSGRVWIRDIGRCLAEFRQAQQTVARSYIKVGG